MIHGLDFTGSTEEAKRLEAEKGYVFVSAFDDEGIVAGQGSAASSSWRMRPRSTP